MPKTPKREPAPPLVRAQYFASTPTVNDEIATWASKKKLRVLAVIPVYVEDVTDA